MATKKVAVKKTAAKKAPAKASSAAASSAASALTSQPTSKLQAATQAQLYLATDDAWSARYWNDGDLHAMERKLFG
ncbi:hypothetical protein SAMN05421819_3479 [Bryocella elongata]|uniref:Uncharacterized protein n=1 Tax=Bryocella elongata TaxID=863522 RepID=A0A1H6B2Z7_9BACT|nr:hypothetical protein [Bryocella elongata]SEG55218.1 hypothetical protein SAMN05421819_3479 [Bryocella elongata]